MAITLMTTLQSSRLRVEVKTFLHADPMQERHELVAFEREGTQKSVAAMRLQRRTVKLIQVSASSRGQGIELELLNVAEGWLGRTLILSEDAVAALSQGRAADVAGLGRGENAGAFSAGSAG